MMSERKKKHDDERGNEKKKDKDKVELSEDESDESVHARDQHRVVQRKTLVDEGSPKNKETIQRELRDVVSDEVKSNVRSKGDRDRKEKKGKSSMDSEELRFDDPDALKRRILELEMMLKKQTNSVLGGSANEAILIHQRVLDADQKAYDQIKDDVQKNVHKVLIQKTSGSSLVKFNSPLAVRRVSEIPSFFSIEVIDPVRGSDGVDIKLENIPKYLQASQRAFAFGITGARFIMKSVNCLHEIHFSPMGKSKGGAAILGPQSGPVNYENSRVDYVLHIFETLFAMYLNAQFVLVDVNTSTLVEEHVFPNDMVSSLNMLKRQFVDQDCPLLPAAGVNHKAIYLPEMLRTLFEPEHRRMRLGELARDTLSRRKILRRLGVVTDQYMAALNHAYLDYLNSRNVNHTMYVEQHRVLTFESVTVRVQNVSVFQNSIIPVWSRGESDGSLLHYALDVKRQKQYLDHLADLLSSINLITFATQEEVSESVPKRNLHDASTNRILDNIINGVNSYECFRALALDLSNTWIDANFSPTLLDNGPLDATFKIFTILLWYCYFPSLARDNSAQLMYELFISLELLIPDECGEYMRDVGFALYNGRVVSLQHFPKEEFIRGTIIFPLMENQPRPRFAIFLIIHQIINRRGDVVQTRDSDLIQTPRLSDIRRVYQPYQQLEATSNHDLIGEIRNEAATLLERVVRVVIMVMTRYKNKFREVTQRAKYGTSDASIAELLAYFTGFTPGIMASVGIRLHSELYMLRLIGADTPYVLDCRNFSFDDRNFRPQVVVQLDNGEFASIAMQRHCEDLPFELPLYLFLTLRGASTLDSIAPPDSNVQFRNLQSLQQEGILFGDIIKYVNNLKFGNVGLFNREALGIANVITAARADRIFGRLSEMSSLHEFKDIFEVLINEVSQRIDSRALSFRIYLQEYNVFMFDPTIVQPRDTLYGRDLRLGRPLLDQMMEISAPIFVPETSPITLYTNGLFITHGFVPDLNPYDYMDMVDVSEGFNRIFLWDPTIVSRVVRDESRFADEHVLEIPNDDGGRDRFRIGDNVPNCLIIVTSRTGSIQKDEYIYLRRFFKEKMVSFLFPELMVIMHREMVDQTAETEIDLELQMEEIVTGLPNRRVIIRFGDTISRIYRIGSVPRKEKYMYPINPISLRDVVLQGVSDQITIPQNLRIGSWMSWAYGDDLGTSIRLRVDEEIREVNLRDAAQAPDDMLVVNKLTLGLVNMNNQVSGLVSPDYLLEPEVEQNVERAYVGIYQHP